MTTKFENASSPEGLTPRFYYHEKYSNGWRPMSELAHFPSKLGAFDPSADEDDDESGWRSWPTPPDAEFTITRPGGRLVVLSRSGEREIG